MPTINQEFLKACQNFAGHEAMRLKTPSGWEIYTYRDILEGAFKVASWLKKQDFRKSDKAVLLLDNGPSWAMVYFGILLAGGVCVPLDPQLKGREVQVFINDSGANFVFIEKRLGEESGYYADFVKKIIVLGPVRFEKNFISFLTIMAADSIKDPRSFVPVAPDDTASILYSSGTTSNPKGIKLTQGNFYANFNSIRELKICDSKDVFISILPLFHAYAFMATLVFPFFIGARIVYPRTMKSAELLGILRETGITMMVGVPELFSTIRRSITEEVKKLPFAKRLSLKLVTSLGWQLRRTTGFNVLTMIYKPVHERFGKTLRYFVSGGARLDPDVATDFQKFGFTILEGYGLTETAPLVTLNPVKKVKPGSVGKVVPGVEIKIVDSDSEGIGEIAIRGPNVMKGYYGKPQETDGAIRQGWFYSGDLGRMDNESYLYITGRIKEIIVLGSGKNIFPDEIEQYYAYSKFIKEIAVFLDENETMPNLKAVVVPNFEAFAGIGQTSVREKIRWDIENISRQMPAYKRIMGFAISKEELPKTRLGKIKRYQLAAMYKKGQGDILPTDTAYGSQEDDNIVQNPMAQKIVEFLKQELSFKREVRITDHLELDLGIDSLKFVELVAGIEKIFKVQLSNDIFNKVSTVKDFILATENALADTNTEGSRGLTKDSWRQILLGFDEKQFSQIELSPGMRSRLAGYVTKTLVFIILKIFCRLEIAGQDNLPTQGPYIICCNHASYLDAFVIVAGLSHDVAVRTYFIGSKEIFDHPLIRWTIRLARVIPIDPSAELIKAMQAAAYVLAHNKILCIFPEGQRSVDGEIKEFKRGIGILVKELKMDVVPAAISGAHEAWPRAVRFPRPHPIKVIFGNPVETKNDLSLPGQSADGNAYDSIADRIRKEVIVLQSRIRRK